MMKKIVIIVFVLLSFSLYAQEHPDFEMFKQGEVSEIKNQGRSGTCWSFATISFIESETLKKNGKEFNLSEMYHVRLAYVSKSILYVRLHGKNNFSAGGQAHDVTKEIVKYGLMPEEAYSGLVNGATSHNHTELDKELKEYLDEVLDKKNIQNDWLEGYKKILDKHLGKVPEKFTYEGVEYTPQEFQKKVVEFNPDDYVELTSFSHSPYYQQFSLEVPDNWSHDLYYNLPIDEFMQVIDYAIENDYTVCWDGDVSEDGFKRDNSRAVLSKNDNKMIENQGFEKYRQHTFNNHTTTDDHLMHLTGVAKEKGEKYYIIKNSWGEYNKSAGYLYMSHDYTKLKTVAIMVNKNAIPQEIRKKLNIK